jgi:hypothetical protein
MAASICSRLLASENLYMVSRVQGGWYYRGGFSLRTDAAARYSFVAKSKLQLLLLALENPEKDPFGVDLESKI